MGWQDRAYHRDEQTGGGFSSRLGGRSVVTWLLVTNVVVFVLDSIFTGSARAGALSLTELGAFSIDKALSGLQIWRLFTYQFLHVDFFHLLFNMIGLFFFGPMIEQWLGSRRFLAFYLLCGMSGAVLFTLLALAPGILNVGTSSYLIGASGSVFGILAACAYLFPRQRVMLIIPPIPMSMRTLALIFMGIAVISLLAGSRNAAGEAAHLGGAALGLVLVKWAWMLNWADFSGPGQSVTRITAQVRERRDTRRRDEIAREEAEVDRILAKVKASGMHSLTEREKKTLQKATERQRWAG